MSGVAGAHRSPRTKLPDSEQHQKGQPPVWRAALFGLCPECGAPTLFDGPTKFAPRCRACGLDYSTYNVLWVHVLLWVPITAAAVVYGLRIGKAALLASEHQRKAAEGRLVDRHDEAA